MSYAKSAPGPATEGKASRKSKVVLSTAILLGFAIALLAIGQTNWGQVWLLRTYLRTAEVWNRVVPLHSGRGLIDKLDPFMSRIGILSPMWFEVEPGINMWLDPSDTIPRVILTSLRTRWDPEVWESISSGLSNGAIMLDVGAHIGYFTLKSSKRVGKSGRVIAFEPDPWTLQTLRANLAANNAANVTIVPVACTDSETTMKFYHARVNSGGSSLSRATASGAGNPHEFTVRGRPIDDVVQELEVQRVDVLKVDVEGAELFVLRGAKNTLKRFHPKIVIEVVPDHLAGMNTTVEQLFSFIKEMGYTRRQQLDDKNWEWTVK